MTPLDNMDSGPAADRRDPSPYNKGKFWFDPDTGTLSVSDGETWTDIGSGSGAGGEIFTLDVRADPDMFTPLQSVNGLTGLGGFEVPLPVDPDNDRRWSIDILGTRWESSHTDPFVLGAQLLAYDAIAFDNVDEVGSGSVDDQSNGIERVVGTWDRGVSPQLSYQVVVPAGVEHVVVVSETIGTFHPASELPLALDPTIVATDRVARVFAQGVAL